MFLLFNDIQLSVQAPYFQRYVSDMLNMLYILNVLTASFSKSVLHRVRYSVFLYFVPCLEYLAADLLIGDVSMIQCSFQWTQETGDITLDQTRH